jgi:predicted ribosome quality control (RQC) complex YloA/Tae2 family protein
VDARAADVSARALHAEIEGLISGLLRGQFEPGTAGEGEQVSAFAAYEITHLPGYRPAESISAALAAFYGAPVGPEAYEAAKGPVRAQLEEAITRVARRVESLQRGAADVSALETLRLSGEMLLAYQWNIAPGATSFSAEYDFDQPPLEIALDSSLSALENAKAYFERYEKAKRAAAEVPGLIAAAQRELDYLHQLESDLTLAANWPEIGEVQDALQTNGYWRGAPSARPKSAKTGPLRVATAEGLVIWVGRNARQNEEVTFSKGKPDDLWLHARGVPGAHVIIKSGGRAVPTGVLQRAAALAAYYSKARGEGRALVDVTERRHVRKAKGGKPGMVTYRNESPVEAVPAPEGAG